MTSAAEDSYIRPSVPDRVYRDAQGQVIAYGERWQGAPPNWAYAVATHPDRFAPLHRIATALVDHLARTRDVVVSESSDRPRGLDSEPPDVVGVLRLDPVGAQGVPLTVALTSFPGVWLYAGGTFVEAFPSCGCDACDDTLDDVADLMEQRVLSLVRGALGWSAGE